MNGQPWTRHEMRCLRRCYMQTPTADLARELGRSTDAVATMAHQLGLRKLAACRKWTAREISLLRAQYANTSGLELAAKLDRKTHEIYTKSKALNLHKNRSFKSRFMKQQIAKNGPLYGSRWTPDQTERLRQLYPDRPTKDVAAAVGHPKMSCYGMARRLGLKKNPAYLSGMLRQVSDRLKASGKSHRFAKGHAPANKGLRRPGYHRGRMRETQFKKGQKCHNWLPIGTEVFKTDGYLYRKMTDTGYPPRDWKQVHRLLWEQHYGPIPPGYRVRFIDDNRRNVTISNLCLVSRADLAGLNRMWNRYPRELCEVIQLRGALNRRINRRVRNEEQHRRSA